MKNEQIGKELMQKTIDSFMEWQKHMATSSTKNRSDQAMILIAYSPSDDIGISGSAGTIFLIKALLNRMQEELQNQNSEHLIDPTDIKDKDDFDKMIDELKNIK